MVVVVGKGSDDASYCLRGIDIGLDRGVKLVSTNRTRLYESEAHDDTSERDRGEGVDTWQSEPRERPK